MSCIGCDGIDLRVRCPQCGRIPDDNDAIALVEVFDLIDYMSNLRKTGGINPQIHECIKILVGVNINLVSRVKELERKLAD